jgi:hypothetical protein
MGKQGRRVVSAFIATAFAQDDAEAARTQWRRVADQLRPKLPKHVLEASNNSMSAAGQMTQRTFMIFCPPACNPSASGKARAQRNAIAKNA